MKKIIVVLVGPQAIGKTTQARLLKWKLETQGYNKICITDLVHYTLLHLEFQKFLRVLCKGRKIMGQFYEDEPPAPTVDPRVYKKLFAIQEALHVLGFALSFAKQKILMMCNTILIEYEGYIFKQLADLWFLAKELKVVEEESFALKSLRKITIFLLSSISRVDTLVIILLDADFETIKARCSKKQSPIEPRKYVTFQSILYDKIITIIPKLTNRNVKVVRINANRSISDVNSDIFSIFLQNML